MHGKDHVGQIEYHSLECIVQNLVLGRMRREEYEGNMGFDIFLCDDTVSSRGDQES